jgi:hypothetical protein
MRERRNTLKGRTEVTDGPSSNAWKCVGNELVCKHCLTGCLQNIDIKHARRKQSSAADALCT